MVAEMAVVVTVAKMVVVVVDMVMVVVVKLEWCGVS